MAELDPEVQAVKAAIEAAFAKSPFPGDRPEGLVVEAIPPERERIAPLFAGKRWEDWKDRPLDMFKPHRFIGGLNFLYPDVFRYYLPIFLLAGLLQPQEAGNVLSETIKLLSDEWGKDWRAMMLEGMTEPQLHAVLRALDYFEKRLNRTIPYHSPYHDEIERARVSVKHYLPPRG